DTDGKYDQETGEATRGSPAKRRPHGADRRALHRIETWPSEIWLERSGIWLVRRLSQKTADFGVIAIDLGRAMADAIKEMRHRKVLRELGWCRGNRGIHKHPDPPPSARPARTCHPSPQEARPIKRRLLLFWRHGCSVARNSSACIGKSLRRLRKCRFPISTLHRRCLRDVI